MASQDFISKNMAGWERGEEKEEREIQQYEGF